MNIIVLGFLPFVADIFGGICFLKMKLQEIKKYFFTYRDGLTADVLKRGGIPHKMIFGLQLPQISSLARSLLNEENSDRRELAEKLWADRDVRESRLLACYLFDPAGISLEKGVELASDVRSQEEADILAFRVLSRMSGQEELKPLLPGDYLWRI